VAFPYIGVRIPLSHSRCYVPNYRFSTAGAGLSHIVASRPGTHVFEFTLDPTGGGGKGDMVDWFGHMGGAMGLHVTILPSQWYHDPEQSAVADVVADVPLLLHRLQQVYLVHDFGPRE